jgi:hypothetical protein
MRVACYECPYAVILPNDPLGAFPPEPLNAHFAATGHHILRPMAPDDMLAQWFEVTL